MLFIRGSLPDDFWQGFFVDVLAFKNYLKSKGYAYKNHFLLDKFYYKKLLIRYETIILWYRDKGINRGEIMVKCIMP